MSSATCVVPSGIPASAQLGMNVTSSIVHSPRNLWPRPRTLLNFRRNQLQLRLWPPVPAIAAPAPAFVPPAPAFPAPAPVYAGPAAPAWALAPPLAPYPQIHAQQQPLPGQPPMPYPHANQAHAAYNPYGLCRCVDCNRRNNPPAHVHTFERHYRSHGADTECDECGGEDCWINICSGCNVGMCWYCTKHGPP
jgi:hypothetical protein